MINPRQGELKCGELPPAHVIGCESQREEHRLSATPTDQLFFDSFSQIAEIAN
jgi:hypothetical protein